MSAMQELLRRYGQSATLKNPAGEKCSGDDHADWLGG